MVNKDVYIVAASRTICFY